jgi:hypothetical protein
VETAYEWLTENFTADSQAKELCISIIDYFSDAFDSDGENIEAIGDICGGVFDLTDDEIKHLIKLREYERDI